MVILIEVKQLQWFRTVKGSVQTSTRKQEDTNGHPVAPTILKVDEPFELRILCDSHVFCELQGLDVNLLLYGIRGT